MEKRLSIFISHRTSDKTIADEVRKNLELWGIPEKNIFQSTHAESGIKPGDEIQQALRDVLRSVDLFILIYTTPDQDWSYCMWELGIATAIDTKPTRVICFCCSNDVPKLMEGILVNRINHEDIKKFTYNLHRADDFISSDKETLESNNAIVSLLKGASDQALEQRALQLYEAIDEKSPSGDTRILHRWDFMSLHLPSSAVKSIKDLGDDFSNRDRQFSLIKKLAVLKKGSQNSAVRAFGFQDFAEGITLQELKNRWAGAIREKRKLSGHKNMEINTDWATDLYHDVLRAIFNWQAKRTFNYFETIADQQKIFFRPAVIKAIDLADDSMDFDVYLYRLGANEMQLINALIHESGAESE